MKKYITLIKIELARITTYRFDLLWHWILGVGIIAVYYYLWNMTSTNPTESKKLLLHFSLFYLIFQNTGTTMLAQNMSKAIMNGSINHFLSKPIKYPLVAMSQVLTKILARVTIPIILLILGVFIYPTYFAPHSIINLLLFIGFTLLWLLLWNSIMLLFGSLSFWFREISSLLAVLKLILNLFNGALIPAFLMPNVAQKTISYTPIHFMGTFQIELYQNSISNNVIFSNFLILSAWTVIILFIARFTYRQGLIKYDASGG